MQEQYETIRKLGGEVLAVSFSPPAVVARFAADHRWPFPVVSDPDATAYRALGLGRASWWSFLRPDVIFRYVKQIFRGWLPRKPYEQSDVLQLGGDFVLNGERRLVYAYRSSDAADRPPVAELLDALHAAARETR